MEDIVLKNFTGAPGYVLPETGGPGTTWFTTGGLALTGLIYKDKKRKGSMKQMKTKRKWLAVLLTVIMTLMLAAPAFAAGETYTITINNGKTGHTYEAYQVFDGDLAGDVLSNIQWGTGVNGDTLLIALKEDDTIGSHFTSCTTAADVAKVLSDNAAQEGWGRRKYGDR